MIKMKNDTLNLLDDLLLHLKPTLKNKDPEWPLLDKSAKEHYEAFKVAHAGNHRLLHQVNDLLDARGGLEEYESQYRFRLGGFDGSGAGRAGPAAGVKRTASHACGAVRVGAA